MVSGSFMGSYHAACNVWLFPVFRKACIIVRIKNRRKQKIRNTETVPVPESRPRTAAVEVEMKEEILELLAEICECDDVKDDMDAELFESGLLDSLGFAEFLRWWMQGDKL